METLFLLMGMTRRRYLARMVSASHARRTIDTPKRKPERAVK